MKDKIIYVEFFPNCRLANQMCQFASGYVLHKKYPEFDLKLYNGTGDIVVCDRWIHYPMLNEFEK